MAEGRVDPESLKHGHELSDVPPRWVAVTALALFATIGLSALAISGLFGLHERHGAPPLRAPTPIERTELTPPAPRLQQAPPRHAAARRAETEAVLNSYGWIDRPAGVARIPIAEAMRILADHGWPDAAGRSE